MIHPAIQQRPLRIYGRKIGEKVPAWSQEFEIPEKAVSSQASQSLSKFKSSSLPEILRKHKVVEQILLECKGENGILMLFSTRAVIKRSGGFLSPYQKGEKSINYTDILNIQYCRSKLGAPGYIYLQVSDSPDAVTFIQANGHENAVTFLHQKVQDFDKATEIFAQKISVEPVRNEVETKVLLECKGDNGILVLTETELVIKRTGGFLSIHQKGEKYFSYDKIMDFQYQRSSLISPGYMYLQLPDLPREVTFIEANSSENAITFQNDNVKSFDKAKEILSHKVNTKKYENFFEGQNGALILTETGVTIKRNGGFLSSHPRGEKNIPYKSITAIQLKPANLTVGFIQFTLIGGVEARGGAFEAVSDENTITFVNAEQTRQFEMVKSIIEQKILVANNFNPASVSSGDLDQLEKLASLRDKGILTEEEFQAKKRQILGL